MKKELPKKELLSNIVVFSIFKNRCHLCITMFLSLIFSVSMVNSQNTPPKVTGVVIQFSPPRAFVSWDIPETGTVNGYEVQRRKTEVTSFDTNDDGTDKIYRTLTSKTRNTITAFPSSNDSHGQVYRYRVRALNILTSSTLRGPWSELDGVYTRILPSEVRNLTATRGDNGNVTINWEEPTTRGRTFLGYQVSRKLGTEFFKVLHSRSVYNGLTYVDDTTEPNLSYTYQVRGNNTDGLSPVALVKIGSNKLFSVGKIKTQYLPILDENVSTVETTSTVDLTEYFEDMDNDTPVYTATSSDNNVATVGVNNNILTITPIAKGTVEISVIASTTLANGDIVSARQTFKVTVNLKPMFESSIDDIELDLYESDGVTPTRHLVDLYDRYLNDTEHVFYTATSSNSSVATANVRNKESFTFITTTRFIEISPAAIGSTDITIRARNSFGETEQTFNVTVSSTNDKVLNLEESIQSTDDFNEKSINVFSVSNRTLKITGLPSERADVQLLDVLGKLILKARVDSDSEIKLSKGIKTGIYIVRINTLKGSLNRKIILTNR